MEMNRSLVLHGKSIYPAVFFHGLLNLAGYLNLTSNAAEGAPSAWLLLSLLMLPVALLGWVLLVSASQRVSPLVTESLVETRERL